MYAGLGIVMIKRFLHEQQYNIIRIILASVAYNGFLRARAVQIKIIPISCVGEEEGVGDSNLLLLFKKYRLVNK